jgi:hypothetical protein
MDTAITIHTTTTKHVNLYAEPPRNVQTRIRNRKVCPDERVCPAPAGLVMENTRTLQQEILEAQFYATLVMVQEEEEVSEPPRPGRGRWWTRGPCRGRACGRARAARAGTAQNRAISRAESAAQYTCRPRHPGGRGQMRARPRSTGEGTPVSP